MPPSPADIVAVANAEWNHWGKCTWNCISKTKSQGFHIDDEDVYAQYVIDTYLPHVMKLPINWPNVDIIGDDQYPWSAVAISHFMAKAGFAKKKLAPSASTPAQYAAWVNATQPGEFPLSQSHSEYIRWAIKARHAATPGAAYWGYRVDETQATPDVGDLIGYPRAPNLNAHKALGFFDRTSNYSSHTDLVVAKRPGEIDVIGGNVRDSVTKKTLALGADGRIADKTHFWFVVLKHRP